MNYWFYIGYAYCIVLFENMYFYCQTNKNENIINTGYWVLPALLAEATFSLCELSCEK